MRSEHEVFGRLFSLSNRLQSVGDRFLHPVSTKQWFLLACIQRFEPDLPSLSELVPVVGSSRQNIKQLALKLERMGFVRISRDTGDSRVLRLALTERCRGYWEQRGERDATFLRQLFAGIDPQEIAAALRVLRAIEQNLEGVDT
ncbi:MarR family winged helix-turn-helix transcriptional regulator [Spirochaeta africana]|uniref:Transcriptional regulator n=1 Tax=Spirochaeta africana (strain ATCC 700263 / DSM 8902 / Z-7692) TaxID=889378 RepID=H9ULA8_SPIAZ|nr:MarR family transcriptional regulator [Spirochaeta africana]AFG38301.1 transcriptional regulator [Spirochaeta africana DSM 8902]